MKRFITNAFAAVVCGGIVAALGTRPAAAAGDDQAVLQADHVLVEAIGKADQAAVGKLLDADFTWTDSQGRTQNRAQVSQNLPTPVTGYDTDAKERTFGQVGVVEASSGKVHVLRVWVKRPAGWRALIYHEVMLSEKATPIPRKTGTSPDRRDKSYIPYQPKTEAERTIIGLHAVGPDASKIRGSKNYDPLAKFRHWADEWVSIDSTRSEPMTKAGRMAEVSAQEQAGFIPSDPQWLSVQPFEFGDTMVEKSVQQREDGKPLHFSRVWIKRDGIWQMLLSYRTAGVADPQKPLAGQPERSGALILVVNVGARTVDVIDPVTNKVVQTIDGFDDPTAIDSSPDGSRIYVSDETGYLAVVDQKTGKTIKKVHLGGTPNLPAASKDGKLVLVCNHADAPRGGVDVVDTTSLEFVKTIRLKHGCHDVYLTADGKHAVAGSGGSPGHFLAVIDLQTDQVAWYVDFDEGVQPMAIENGPDGSPRRIFVQHHLLNGFGVVDFAKRKEVETVKFPHEPRPFSAGFSRSCLEKGRVSRSSPHCAHSPSHGMGIAPDGTTFWLNSIPSNALFVYSLPELKLLGRVPLPLPKTKPTEKIIEKYGNGASPNWITFTPDGKTVYVSNSAINSVSAIDVETKKEVALIPVGAVPRRMSTLLLP